MVSRCSRSHGKGLLNLSMRTRWTHFSNILNPDIENSYCCSLLPSRRSQLWYWIELEVVSRNLMRLLAMKWLCQFPVLVSSYNGRIWNSKIHSASARQRLLIDLQFNFTGTLCRKSTHFWLLREYFVNGCLWEKEFSVPSMTNKFLIKTTIIHVKLFTDQSEVSALRMTFG